MSDEAVRKEFEAWFLKDHPKRDITKWGSAERYNSEFARVACEAWQAARSAAIQECAAELRINGEAQAVACIEALALKER